MRLYLATWPPEKQVEQTIGQSFAQQMANNMKLRILLSYHYYKDTNLDELFEKYFTPPYPDVFIDSGGFSAKTQGVDIDIVAYADWLKRFNHLISVSACLDVIGDAEKTAVNQKRLEDMGLEVIPVFHTGSDFAVLEKMVDEYPYIALGGMVPFMRFPKRIMPWLIKAFRIAKGKAVFHGFGGTAWEIVSNLPWYSVDSSSWGSGFRFGQVPLFDERKGGFITTSLGNIPQWKAAAPIVREMGFDPIDFADRQRNDRAKICAISALSYMRAERWLRKRHGEIHIPDKDAPAGLRVHLVTADSSVNASRGSNMGVRSLAESGLKLHLAEASAEINDIRLAVNKLNL